MSERRETFQMAGPARLVLRVPSGEVRLVAGPPGEVVVRCRGEERYLSRLAINRDGDTIDVGPEGSGFGHWSSLDVEIAVETAPAVRARFGSTDLTTRVGVSSLEVAGASGDVTVESIEGAMTVRLASGDLEVESVGGRADVVTASGRVRIKEVGGAADVKAASGDVLLGSVAGDATVRTASGRVTLSRFGGSRCEAKTVSGDVRVGVPSGRRYALALRTLSGDVRTDFPVSKEGAAAPARINVTSVSGDIRIIAADG